jgi:hypothetical protein
MTLEEMLTLDYDKERFAKIKPECVMNYCDSRIKNMGRCWYITTNPETIEQVSDSLWIDDNDGSPVHVMQWQEFYIVGLMKPAEVRIDDRDEYMESLGWELIPTKYYSREVEGT